MQTQPEMNQTDLAIPGYELCRELGTGGMGTVWLARQRSLGRHVAVKLHRPFAGAEEHARFERESRLMASMRHPNIVFVVDRGQEDGQSWIAMEYVEGPSLAEAMQEHGRYSLNEVVALLQPICNALHEMHELGVVHRDLKPGNILLGHDGRPRLTDFGLAVAVDEVGDLTRPSLAVGTIDYMSPEQRNRLPVDERSDQFSLAAIAYELLTGRKPVGVFESPSELNDTLQSDVDDVLLRGLARDPDNRFETVSRFLDALSLCRTTSRRRDSAPLAVKVLFVVALLCPAVWNSNILSTVPNDDLQSQVVADTPALLPDADAKSETEDSDPPVELNALTVAELRDFARENDLVGHSNLVRSQLLDLIENGNPKVELPPGWRTEDRVDKRGRLYRWYISPEGKSFRSPPNPAATSS